MNTASNSEPKIGDVMVAINSVAKQVSSQLAEIQSTISFLKDDVEKRQNSCEKNIVSHSKQLKTIFKRETRKNLVIIGWEEVTKCTIQIMRDKIFELLVNKLEIRDVRRFDIYNVRVVGRNKNVIIAGLCSPELVRMAVTSGSKLAGTKIFLKYDTSPEEREQRKKLLEYKRTLSGLGKECKLRNKVLIVDSIPHTLAQLENDGESKNSTSNPKRPLSVSPYTPENKKKTKKRTPTSDNEREYLTDEEEFERTSNQVNVVSKNGVHPQKGSLI